MTITGNTIHCDICKKPLGLPPPLPGKPYPPSADEGWARSYAKSRGWTFSADRLDLCSQSCVLSHLGK